MSRITQFPPASAIVRTANPDASESPNILSEADGSFRALFLSNPQPMWVYDAETLQFLEVNEAAIQHYGYSREEFLKMRITDIRPPEDVPRLLAEWAKVHSALQYSGTWRHLLKDGTLIDAEVVVHTLTFRMRNAKLAAPRDITAQKRAEDALKQAERKYRLMFEEAIVGMYQTSPEGRLLAVNRAMAEMFGYKSGAEMISAISDVQHQLYVDPERREEFKKLLQEQGVVQHFEIQVYRKDGSRMWLWTNARVVREGGNIARYEGTFEDITERKLLEDQLRQAQKMEAVGRLAGGVAHDFNNALGVITGYGELLQIQLREGDPLHKHAEEICKAGRRAAGLTRQLLAFSRKQIIQPVALDLNVVIGDMEKMLRRLIGEDIEISFRQHPQLWLVKADPGQIEQILMNLAVNSRDAMPKGGKLIIETANAELDVTYARQHAGLTPGSYITLSVSDTGCGMDRETQAHIFEPFFTTKEAGKGTGLGLSTVYGIAKQNEGYIRVYSEVGRGTTFKIFLPRTGEAAEASKSTAAATMALRGSETVLLVEDEDPLRELARGALEDNGYRVLDAADPSVATKIAHAYRDPIHLLLTDVIMPGGSGRDLARALTASRPDIKVLYMSGYTNELVAQYGVLGQELALLEKPFTLHSLLAKVHRVLHSVEMGKATAAGSSSHDSKLD